MNMLNKTKLLTIISVVIEWSLLAAIFFVPIYFAFFQENFSVFDLNKSVWLVFCLLMAISAWLILVALSGKLPSFKSKSIFLAWCVLSLAMIISTILSLHPKLSLLGSYERHQGLHNILAYLLFFLFIATFFNNRAKVRKLIITLNLSAFFVCLYGLAQAFGLDFLYWSESSASRIFSTFGQPNFFGHYLVVIIPLTVYSLFFISRRFFIRILFLVLLMSELICLFFTYSRSAWLAILAASFVALVYCLWHFKKRIFSISLVALVTIVITILLLPGVRLRLISKIDYNNSWVLSRVISSVDFNYGASFIRLKYWRSSLELFRDAPLYRKLFGFGPETLASVFVTKYQPDWAYHEQLNSFPDRAHNNLFDITLQFGLVGLLSLLVLAWFCVKELFRVLSHEAGENYWLALAIGASLIAYTVNNFLSFSLTAMSLLFFVLLALAWRINKFTDQITYRALNFFHPLSRWLMAGAGIIFMLIMFYGYDIRPLVADYYFMQVKKAEARQDCFNTLNNMENVMAWYPTNHFYARAYLAININCFSSAGSDEVKQKIINNIIDQTKNLPAKESQFYTLIDLSHAYSILGYYADPKYYSLAEDYYKTMLKLGPNITTTYQDYGRMKLWQAKYEEARKLFFSGIAVIPPLDKAVPGGGFTLSIAKQLAYFHYLIGLTYKNENKVDQAISEYKQALAIDPTATSAYKDLADISYKRKNILEAINYTKQAFAVDPNGNMWALNLAILYSELGNKTSALRYAQQAIKIDPNSAEVKKILEKLK